VTRYESRFTPHLLSAHLCLLLRKTHDAVYTSSQVCIREIYSSGVHGCYPGCWTGYLQCTGKEGGQFIQRDWTFQAEVENEQREKTMGCMDDFGLAGRLNFEQCVFTCFTTRKGRGIRGNPSITRHYRDFIIQDWPNIRLWCSKYSPIGQTTISETDKLTVESWIRSDRTVITRCIMLPRGEFWT